jgi:hypothetical protein
MKDQQGAVTYRRILRSFLRSWTFVIALAIVGSTTVRAEVDCEKFAKLQAA